MELNVEQRKIVESKPNGHSLVKGVAGSGKTTVAVYKIPILLNYYCPNDDDNILMVTYNKSLTKYVEYIYKKDESKNNMQESLFGAENEKKLHIKNIDSLMYGYFKKYESCKNIDFKIATKFQVQKALKDSIISNSKKYTDIDLLDVKNLSFIRDEILWIKSCNYTVLEEYQNVDRIGRTNQNSSEGPQKLRKNSRQREAIFAVMSDYNENLREESLIDFQDMAAIALKYVSSNNCRRYTHILIDESQDLSRVQLEFLKALYNEKEYSSITFLADVAQSIYLQAWLTKNRSFTTIGYNMSGKSNSLSKNYRTTTQIAQAAYSLIEKDEELVSDSNFVKANLIDRQGEYPIYVNFRNSLEEGEYVCSLIRKLQDKYSLKDIVIIARLNEQLKEMKGILENRKIPSSIFTTDDKFDFSDETIKLISMHSIKGLEFKVVIMVGLNSKVMPYLPANNDFEDIEIAESTERKLLYVGMTRATEKLYISSSERPSKFIKDINYRYLRIKENCKFRRINSININNYMFKDKIKDIYSQEEKVRQWLLAELIETYNYPINLLNIEERINIGSKTCFADISVNVYKDYIKNPYILVETKQWNSGITDGMNQLKSYMSNCPSVQYGIITDGNKIEIINKNLEHIDDIPKFKSSMLKSSIIKNEYIDIKKKRSHIIIRDSNSIDKIYLEEMGIENEVENIKKIDIYSNIAAGKPILINDEKQGIYYLPKDLISTNEQVFMLKIKGDSMINKNINDGDYVLIKKQNCAEPGDIAAVNIDGEATLKTYKTLGDNILLMPENDSYEPFILKEDQFSILGVAIGIIKNK